MDIKSQYFILELKLFLNLFNQHCSRVRGANIAQTVNVLQAMVLTEQDGERMVLTPTYHVFEMYKEHQDATLVSAALSCTEYACGDEAIPALSASASRAVDDSLLITICNLHPEQDHDLACEIRGMAPDEVSGRILTASSVTAHNTFDVPDAVLPVALPVPEFDAGRLLLRVPARSVVALQVN